MNAFLPVATAVCSFLLTYLMHSTLVILASAIVVRRMKSGRYSELRVLVWKAALILPIVTTFAVTVLPLPHFGAQLALADAEETEDVRESLPAIASIPADVLSVSPTPEAEREYADVDAEQFSFKAESPSTVVSLPAFDTSHFWAIVALAWFVAAVCGFIKLIVQIVRLRRLRTNASVIDETVLSGALSRISERMKFRRKVELLQSTETAGPITAGIRRPFILLPAAFERETRQSAWEAAADRHTTLSEVEAVLAHELAHIRNVDALWNLVAQLIVRAIPFQPLNRWVSRRLKKNMDFVADLQAAQILGERAGLIRCLVRLGRKITDSENQLLTKAGLAAGMVAFRSTLGQRVEILVDEREELHPSSRSLKRKLLIVMIMAAMLAASILPQAVAETPLTRNKTMKEHLTTLALLIGLTAPTAADAVQEQPAAAEKPAELKTTPDELPDGIRNFNGMLVGRLAAKDVETGTFVVYIDAVPRVWRNSRAENPKSVVGKTIEVGGVFGKFLDVLVVTRKGESLEFECKYDGEKLVFPGELLRKVAPYKAEDYPVLPEEFRGFRGTVNAEIVKKDPETFELIVKVHKVMNTGEGNSAKNAESIEGKNLMLAGFWNRKEAYHNLKVGDRIEAGMQHIATRSDHLNVTEIARKPGNSRESKSERGDGESAKGGLSRELRGFRGMLVGKLVEKDIERGTFSIKVDAVPRVWNNNKSSNPKAFIGRQADAEGVHGKMLDALVVTRVGDTIEFGALHDEGGRLRVGEVLRKVAPVKKGDYPELPDGFRGFKGMLTGKVVKKDDQLMDLVIEVKSIEKAFEGSRAKQAESIVGKRAMLAGFWRRKEVFHNIEVGDTIRCGVEHPQRLSDHLSVIESVKKIED